jgi:hypothetical protein
VASVLSVVLLAAVIGGVAFSLASGESAWHEAALAAAAVPFVGNVVVTGTVYLPKPDHGDLFIPLALGLLIKAGSVGLWVATGTAFIGGMLGAHKRAK